MGEAEAKGHMRGRMPSGEPNPIDVHVGGRVRLRRLLIGMTQEQLGAELGLTFQQVQKYERGANRIGCSRLYDLGRVLNVPVSFFFDDMSEEISRLSPRAVARGDFSNAAISCQDAEELLNRKEAIPLVRAFFAITDRRVRRQVYELAKALGGANADE